MIFSLGLSSVPLLFWLCGNLPLSPGVLVSLGACPTIGRTRADLCGRSEMCEILSVLIVSLGDFSPINVKMEAL
jgi:hypothetical protein